MPANPVLPGIVLDKSFLEGKSRARLEEVARSHQFLMSGALLYEPLSTTPRQRSRCFGKLPRIENPLVVVDNVGEMLRREQQTHKPCGRPSENRPDIRYKFHPSLRSTDYELPEVDMAALREEALELNAECGGLIRLSETVGSIAPQLLQGSDGERRALRIALEQLVADSNWIREFYRSLPSPSDAPFPSADIVTTEWAYLRWMQVRMLFAVDVYVRYQGRVREMMTDAILERLEHDVHDAQHLALAILEGGFATCEKKLIEWWRLLLPNGTLFV